MVRNEHLKYFIGNTDEVENEENTVPLIVGIASGVLFLGLCCLTILLGYILRKFHQKRYAVNKATEQ